MTEQTHEQFQTVYEAPLRPISAKQVISNHWMAPTITLLLGAIISALYFFMIPVYSLTYVAILLPICILTAITQLSLGIINEINKHGNKEKL